MRQPHVFIQRVAYPETDTYPCAFAFIHNEMVQYHCLHQGWGAEEMDLNDSFENFELAWKKRWPKDCAAKKIKQKYSELRRMLDIQPGDLIVIPKFDWDDVGNRDKKRFIIVQCEEAYQFETKCKFVSFAKQQKKETREWDYDDFRHCIKVSPSVWKNTGIETDEKVAYLLSKLQCYRCPVNRVQKNEVIDAVIHLYKQTKRG